MKNTKKNYSSYLLLAIILLIVTKLLGVSPSKQAYDDFYEKGKVTRVVDGDTAIIEINGKDKRVRFTSINTPEYDKKTGEGEYYGKEAYEFSKENLTGKTVYLEKDFSDTDKYNRLLRYIWIEAPMDPKNPTKSDIENKMFNGILVKEGYAFSGNYRPDIKYKSYLDQIEADAKRNKKGMWKK